MKINKLILKNFKFFYGEETFEFDGKNILIYGENGSGKSSIYWALYTMLNNAKSQDRKIQKYFTHHDDKSLLNRYILSEESGKVSIELDNTQKYTISADPLEVNINKSDTTIKVANLASDFISYKLLSKLYDFKHGDTIDLFGLFESDIFDYMDFDTHKTYMDEWVELKRIERNPPRKNSWSYNNFDMRVRRFNDVFKSFVSSIKESTNELLEKYFSANYTVEISYRDLYYHDKPRFLKDRYLKNPKVNITIKLNSQGLIECNRLVKKPHTFLNEAKLTAIALSIRLAVLRTRVTGENILKILVLDDLLISLDMSNRDIVLHMLIEDEYLKDYQIILLTHDKSFFEVAKQIFDYKQKDKWKFYEMYIDKDENCTVEKPFIKEYNSSYSYIDMAKEHFKNKDYPACANYLRKEVEKQFDKYLKLENLDAKINLAKLKENSAFILHISKDLKKLLKVLKQFENCEKIPPDIQLEKCKEFSHQVITSIESITKYIDKDLHFEIEGFDNIKVILKNILHPQSHDDITKPLYKKELEDATKLIEELREAIEERTS